MYTNGTMLMHNKLTSFNKKSTKFDVIDSINCSNNFRFYFILYIYN